MNSTSVYKDIHSICICYYDKNEHQPDKNFKIENAKVKKSCYEFHAYKHSIKYLSVKIWMDVPKECRIPTSAQVVAIKVHGLMLKNEINRVKETFSNLRIRTHHLAIKQNNESQFTYEFKSFTEIEKKQVHFEKVIKSVLDRLDPLQRKDFSSSVKRFVKPKKRHTKFMKLNARSNDYLKFFISKLLLNEPPSYMVNDLIEKCRWKQFENEEILKIFFHRAACHRYIDEAIQLMFSSNFIKSEAGKSNSENWLDKKAIHDQNSKQSILKLT
jgi:hypothetical protein